MSKITQQGQEVGVEALEWPDPHGGEGAILTPESYQVCPTNIGVSSFHMAQSALCSPIPWDRVPRGGRSWMREEMAPLS